MDNQASNNTNWMFGFFKNFRYSAMPSRHGCPDRIFVRIFTGFGLVCGPIFFLFQKSGHGLDQLNPDLKIRTTVHTKKWTEKSELRIVSGPDNHVTLTVRSELPVQSCCSLSVLYSDSMSLLNVNP